MPPRSSWKGFIRLSLVSVPVKAFTANATGSEIRLNQLHADCHNRIKYQKRCPEHGEVEPSEIVSGYEFAKGQYVVIDTDEISKLRPKGDHTITIGGFVDPAALEAMYFAGKTYYLLPDGPVGQKPYGLLRQGMVDNELTAIGQVVIAGREQLVMLRPLENLIVMSVLHHDAKVKKPEQFADEIVDAELADDELKLTNTLIKASTIEDFDFSTFKDEYVENLSKLIQIKVDGEELVEAPDPDEPKIINLMEALKKSVAQAQGGGDAKDKPARKSQKKMAPSAKPAAKKSRKKSG